MWRLALRWKNFDVINTGSVEAMTRRSDNRSGTKSRSTSSRMGIRSSRGRPLQSLLSGPVGSALLLPSSTPGLSIRRRAALVSNSATTGLPRKPRALLGPVRCERRRNRLRMGIARRPSSVRSLTTCQRQASYPLAVGTLYVKSTSMLPPATYSKGVADYVADLGRVTCGY